MSSNAFLLSIALAALVIGGAALAIIYNREINHARASAASGGRIAQTSAGRIEYAETGSGTALLSIHGSGGGYDQGLAIASELVGDGFRVLAPSRFGYLGTPIPADASPLAQAEAHAALLAALMIDRPIVVGTSAGALSAVELALRHPDRVTALILIVPATYAPTSAVAIEGSRGSRFAFCLVNAGADFIWWAIEKIAPSILIRFTGVSPEYLATASPAQRERAMRTVRKIQPLSKRFAGIAVDSRPVRYPPPLEAIKVPTLVISARDDLFNTLPAAEFAAATIPNAKLVVFETGGHLLVGREAEVRSEIASFLAQAGMKPAST
ncbi:MAG: alpha/beta hydrolase [Xanthobacteraceae bacterium]|nr:alpha/beta hydrolase [Xanthobacteraceae bacterium]